MDDNCSSEDDSTVSLVHFINDEAAVSKPSSSSWQLPIRDLFLSSLDIECNSSGELFDI